VLTANENNSSDLAPINPANSTSAENSGTVRSLAATQPNNDDKLSTDSINKNTAGLLIQSGSQTQNGSALKSTNKEAVNPSPFNMQSFINSMVGVQASNDDKQMAYRVAVSEFTQMGIQVPLAAKSPNIFYTAHVQYAHFKRSDGRSNGRSNYQSNNKTRFKN
jgi:hypothetical protein